MTSDPLGPEVGCWTHPTIEVRESPIEGRGLFATGHISRGELVARLGGRIVNTAELRHLLEESDQYVDSITVAEDSHLVLPPRRTIGYGNHSCDPNLWWEGQFNLVARHDIEPGDEVATDYGGSTTDPDFAMECRCGADECRRIVRGTDAVTHGLATRYEGHVVPGVAAVSR